MATELAAAFVSLVPSFKGGQATIAKAFGGPAEQAGEKSGSMFGGKFTAAAAVAVAAGATAVVAGLVGAMNLDAANDKLAAQLGLTQAESKRIGGVAGRLFANAYGDSIETVNEATRGVIQNIDGMRNASSDRLEDITARALDLTTAFDEDLAGATRAIGVIMRTGLADSAEHAFDILTRGMQTGANGSQDLLDTFTEYPALFARLGLDGETAMGLLNQGLASGARNSDLVADALKEFQIRATDASETSAEGFAALGLDAEKMTARIAKGGGSAAAGLETVLDALRSTEDPVARNAAAVALFGTQAEDLGDSLFALDPGDAVKSLGQVTGASDKLGETLNDNAKTNLTSFTRQAKLAFVNIIGGVALPAVASIAATLAKEFGPALEAIGEFLHDDVLPGMLAFGRFVDDNQTVIKTIAAVIVAFFIPTLIKMGVVAVINAAKTAAAFVVTQAAAVRAAVASNIAIVRMVAGWVLMGTQALLNAARIALAWLIALGPIALVIAAVIGLVVLIVANWETIWKWTKKIFTAVWNFLKGIWDRVVDFIGKAIGFVKDIFFKFHPVGIIAKNWDPIWGFVTGLWDKVMGFVKKIPGRITGFLSGMWDVVKSGAKSAMNAAIGLINSAIGGLNVLIGTVNKIPGVSIPSISLLPRLAQGGIVRATPGGMAAILGEGRQDEAVIPLNKLTALMGGQSGGVFEGNLFLESGEWLGKVRGEVRQEMSRSNRDVVRRTHAGAGRSR